jgi:hypothetical protein
MNEFNRTLDQIAEKTSDDSLKDLLSNIPGISLSSDEDDEEEDDSGFDKPNR